VKGIGAAIAVLGLSTIVASAAGGREVLLPRSGVAVQTSLGVELVGLDGRLRSTLGGFRFRSTPMHRPGQVALRDRAGKSYELRGGILTPVAANEVSLAGGHTLTFRGGWTLLREGTLVERFAPRTHLELDDSGMVLTSFRVGEDGAALALTVARHLGTGARRVLPRGCRVGAEREGVRFELCGYPFVKTRGATIVRVNASGRRTFVGSGPGIGRRWWRRVALSPAGDYLLAETGPPSCGTQVHLLDVRRGPSQRTDVLATTRDGAAAQAVILGWAGRAALVAMRRGDAPPFCMTAADRPGIWAFDRHAAFGQERRLIYPLSGAPATNAALFWR
jgi:hypothetical protein